MLNSFTNPELKLMVQILVLSYQKSSQNYFPTIKQKDKMQIQQQKESIEQIPTNFNSLDRNSVTQLYNEQNSLLQKTYTKQEFITIINELGGEDALYYCQRQKLCMIYDKTISQHIYFTGSDLAEFANCLKQQNKQSFLQEISFYKEYILKTRQKHSNKIVSKQLLGQLYRQNVMGYLTDGVYEVLRREEEISLSKLEELIREVECQFGDVERVAIPKRLELRRSINIEGEGERDYIQYDIMQRNQLSLQTIITLKQQILLYIQDPQHSQHIQKQLDNVIASIQQLTRHKIPELQQEVSFLTGFKKQLQQQLTNNYQQLEKRSSQIVDLRNLLLQMTQQNRQLNKELIRAKISLTQREQLYQEIVTINHQLQTKLKQQQRQTNSFFNQYTSLKNDYQQFISQLQQQQQEKRIKQQQTNNLFPKSSLKQQLEDANFKILRLKDDRVKLISQLQNNQNNFIAKISSLQTQLENARNNAQQAQILKFTGMSRLSKNYQLSKYQHSKISPSKYEHSKISLNRKSLLASVVSVWSKNQGESSKEKKMGEYIKEVDEEMLRSRKQLNNMKMSRQFSDASMMRILKDQEQYNQKQGQVNGLEFQDKLQPSFCRQSRKEELKFNFTQLPYDELKRKWQGQNPDIIDEQLPPIFNDSLKKKLSQQAEQMKQQIVKKVNLLPEPLITNSHPTTHTTFIAPVQVISKSGNRYKKHLLFNRKGVFMFDTKLRLEKEIHYNKILKITFTYYNLDSFVISFRKKDSPMKKKVITNQTDLVFRCLRTRQLLSFLAQPVFRQQILKENNVSIGVQKQSNIIIHDSTDKDITLTQFGNFYSPFRINLSLKNHHSHMFYAELSRENLFSRSFIIICIVEEFGVYCFQWTQDQLEKEKKFIYLLPLVKRMLFLRELETDMVKLVYEDWSDGKTFLLRFKNAKQSLKFQTVCKDRLKNNMKVLNDRKSLIENLFPQRKSHIKSNENIPQALGEHDNC